MRLSPAGRLVCVMERGLLPRAIDAIAAYGCRSACVQDFRRLRLGPPRALNPLKRPSLLDSSACLVSALLPLAQSKDCLSSLILSLGLDRPGHGSAYAETIEAIVQDEAPIDMAGAARQAEATPLPLAGVALNPEPLGQSLSSDLAGVICIAQRGQGDLIARVALEMGFSAPAVGFGDGMGMRSKLGLLRVAMPSQKEIAHFLLSRDDADEALALMADTIGLNLPGRGFIYSYDVDWALADTLISSGHRSFQVASMEQVIAAIDGLSGGQAWRRRFAAAPPQLKGRRGKSEASLRNLSLSCAEGLAEDYIRAAMDVGARGATLYRVSQIQPDGKGSWDQEPRERSELILDQATMERVLEVMESMGFFGPEARGQAELSKVRSSLAYSPRAPG